MKRLILSLLLFPLLLMMSCQKTSQPTESISAQMISTDDAVGTYELFYKSNNDNGFDGLSDVKIVITSDKKLTLSYVNSENEKTENTYEIKMWIGRDGPVDTGHDMVNIGRIADDPILERYYYIHYENDKLNLQSAGISYDTDGTDLGYAVAKFRKHNE